MNKLFIDAEYKYHFSKIINNLEFDSKMSLINQLIYPSANKHFEESAVATRNAHSQIVHWDFDFNISLKKTF